MGIGSKVLRLPYEARRMPADAIYTAGRTVLRPILQIEMVAPSGHAWGAYALVDSGADDCLFPLSLMRLLRLDQSALPSGFTFGLGSLANRTYYEHVTIRLGGGLSFRTIAGFSSGLSVGLLGQRGFFENFDVEFRQRERLFTISSGEA